MSEKQGVLSYRTEGEQTRDNLTGLSGLAPYVDLMAASGVVKSLGDRVSICGDQGWTDEEMGLSLLLLNLAGGDCVDDLEQLNADKGFCKLLSWCVNRALSRRQRREVGRR